MLESVKLALDDYRHNYRRPGLPEIELSCLYALFPQEGERPASADSRWNSPFPNSDRQGCYLIFGESGKLLYVGKASGNARMGGRLGMYFGHDRLTGDCRVLSHDWNERPMYVATIAVPNGMGFEASALEEYLVNRLNPCDCEMRSML